MSTLDPDVWVDQHGDYLFRFAMLRLRNESVAEELVQETFLAALQSQNRFEGKASLRTWLAGILKHKIIDHFRRTRRELPDGLEPSDPRVDTLFDENRYWHHDRGPVEWTRDPGQHVEQTEFWRVLDHCLGELTPRQANAFTLRELDEMETEEICKVLGITSTNLWVTLHRARAHLRLCLETDWFGVPAK